MSYGDETVTVVSLCLGDGYLVFWLYFCLHLNYCTLILLPVVSENI